MATPRIFAKTIEASAQTQIHDLAHSEAYSHCDMAIMPDVHAGSGCTIGTVIKMQHPYRIVPNTVGVDISCGILVIPLGKTKIDLPKLDDVIHKHVPCGFNIHEKPVLYFQLFDQLRCKDILDEEKVNCAIGSLGGGNHFIEVDEDADGNHYLVVHSGSRNLGKKVCDHYQQIALKRCSGGDQKKALVERLKSEGREKEIQTELKKLTPAITNKDLAYLDEERDKEAYENYINDMCICQDYANLNRRTIVNLICQNMGWVYTDWFMTPHNYIDLMTMTIRKGAVEARDGQRIIIPMNMRDGSLICIGKGNSEWLSSAPHGAGRLMSRGEARKTLSVEDFQNTMSGIYSSTVCAETIDEAPMAYKPASEIMECIKDTVEIVNVIKPIYNFKAKQ